MKRLMWGFDDIVSRLFGADFLVLLALVMGTDMFIRVRTVLVSAETEKKKAGKRA